MFNFGNLKIMGICGKKQAIGTYTVALDSQYSNHTCCYSEGGSYSPFYKYKIWGWAPDMSIFQGDPLKSII